MQSNNNSTNKNPYNPIYIADTSIGIGSDCFVIAEIGSNHDGELWRAKQLIDIAATAKCDAVKIQIPLAAECYPPKTKYGVFYGDEEISEVIRRNEIPNEWVPQLKRYAHDNGLLLGASADGFIGLQSMIQGGVDFVKIPSFTISHTPLMREVALQGLPVLISTGVHTLGQVEEALVALDESQVGLLHCVSAYPTEINEVHLSNIHLYKQAFSVPVGFSDHSIDPIAAPGLAVAIGADIVEKHFTYDRSAKGTDHFFAIEPDELIAMVDQIRKIENDDEYKQRILNGPDINNLLGHIRAGIYDAELPFHKPTRTGIYFLRDVEVGDVLNENDVRVFRCADTEPGLHPRYLEVVVGARVVRNAKQFESLSWAHLIDRK